MMQKLDDNSIALIVTSPPYWNLVDYQEEGQYGQGTYDDYLNEMLTIYQEAHRVLKANGKFALVVPIVPLAKQDFNDTHTRKIINLSSDIEQVVLNSNLDMHRYSLYIWQKQTSKKMFGSYPYPPNIYEDNTIEFINVFVKGGKPAKIDSKIKAYSKMSQAAWLNLSMQVWPIMPTNIQRKNRRGHPAPFPVEIPRRLIEMYSFKAIPELDFAGDIILDMFNGSGSTCLAAKQAGRRYIGIDLNASYCAMAAARLANLNGMNAFMLDRIKMSSASVTAQHKQEQELLPFEN